MTGTVRSMVGESHHSFQSSVADQRASGQSDRKHDALDRAVDTVIAMLERT